MKGWIGVDLDGTLAHYDSWVDELHIGEPVPAMVAKVVEWLSDGVEVRIFTARVCERGREGVPVEQVRKLIEDWSLKHIGAKLAVTNVKDFGMIELWDDRAVRVEKNTGHRIF